MTNLSTLPALEFGAELRRQREHLGLTQHQLATRLHYTDALIGLVETGKRLPAARLADSCDALFAAHGCFSRLGSLVRRFGKPDLPLPDLLAAASTLRLSDPLLVPALAQTNDYARALMHASHQPASLIDKALDTRPQLGGLLAVRPGLRAWLVLDEVTLYRAVGGAETLRLQLKELIGLADGGRVIIQVLPASAAASAILLDAPLVLLSFPDGADIAHLPDGSLLEQTERYGDAAFYGSRHDLLRSVAWPPVRSLAAITAAAR